VKTDGNEGGSECSPARQTLDGTWQVLYCNTTMPGLIAYRVLQRCGRTGSSCFLLSSNTLMPFLPPHERPIPHSLDRCPCSLPFPPGVATLEDLKLHIAGDTLTVVAKIKLLDMVAELELVSSLTPESDIRIRETCAGILTFPTFQFKLFLTFLIHTSSLGRGFRCAIHSL